MDNRHGMDNRPIEEPKNERIVKKTGMYISLFICIAALILGFWSAVNRTAKLSAKGAVTTANYSQIVKEVERRQTDVTADNTEQTNSPTVNTPTESPTVSPTADFFVIPVGGETVKGYSASELQYSKTYKDWRIHTGVDIAAAKGTEVHSAGNGTVLAVYEDDLLGNVVKIDHGNDIIAFYCGLNSPTVKVGQVVEVGQTLGGIGDIPCESVDETHMHFAVTVKEEWADPIAALGITEY